MGGIRHLVKFHFPYQIANWNLVQRLIVCSSKNFHTPVMSSTLVSFNMHPCCFPNKIVIRHEVILSFFALFLLQFLVFGLLCIALS